jgi:hypothetical protein
MSISRSKPVPSDDKFGTVRPHKPLRPFLLTAIVGMLLAIPAFARPPNIVIILLLRNYIC